MANCIRSFPERTLLVVEHVGRHLTRLADRLACHAQRARLRRVVIRAEREALRNGPMQGRVRASQRAASVTLDLADAEREALSA